MDKDQYTEKGGIELAQWAMDHAIKSGADQAAVSISKQKRTVIEFRKGKIDKLEQATRYSLGLRIYMNKRFSVHSTNDLRKQSLSGFIERGLAGTPYLAEDEFRSLPEPELYPNESQMAVNLNIRDPQHEDIPISQKIEIASAIEAAAMESGDRIISAATGFTDAASEGVTIHSNGFRGETQSTMFSAGASVTVKGDNSDRPEDWFYAATRFYADLPAPGILGENAAKRAIQKIGQKKTASGKYDMIVENRACLRLVSSFPGPMSGRALQQKNSYMENMLGKKVASPLFSMTDDPTIPKRFGSRRYDGEGIAAIRRPMIEKGILKQYYIDTYYGKKLGVTPTTGSLSNLCFETGNRSLDEMIRDMKSGILVTGFLGGSMNSTTGDFSFGISGLCIENGEISRPVNEMNISGNMTEFWDRLVESGNDPYPYASVLAPSMRFEGVAFSGA